jgi:hypothetical protein
MTEEVMLREDRMGKMLAFLGGCLTDVLGAFAIVVITEMSSQIRTTSIGKKIAVEEVDAMP